ncbi:LysR substrate-binding domain-containing protein [Nocardia jiangxiensis]|uniref:LysR substrate-binding domain-containing protein n=1 Tax=Nocardia jiangxiensis TaxID=282685 RepID=A0ABW6S6Q9_9NOCA
MRHLLLIDALSEYGSVVRAAEHLHITQPVATRALHELEKILGVRLFDRGPRGIHPTIFGTAFTEHARAVLGQLRQAGNHVADLAEGATGTVVVGNHLAGANILLPRAIARAKADHPNLTVVVHEANPDALMAELLAGRVDLIVGRLTSHTAPARITQKALYREPIRLVTRDGHPARELADPSLSALIDYPWILPIGETALRRELEDVFFRAELPLPRNRVECTSVPTLRQLLLETNSIAALPMLVAHHDTELAPLTTPLPSLGRPVGVTMPTTRHLSPSAQVLLEQLYSVTDDIRAAVAESDL